ncbi:MAG TPA: hypothetical protein PLF40_00250 [Kofleriaceae bacterium]|nr:hypothetical protein [Kofleriaceae bacterium]
MRASLFVSALLFATLGVAACTDNEPDDLADVEDATGGLSNEDGAAGKADALSSTATLYTLRHDDRRCRFPECGGWWLSRINFEQTKCANGVWASECYVGALDWTPAALDPVTIAAAEDGLATKRVILRGRYAAASAGEFGAYTVFKINEAYRGIGNAEATGTFYFLKDNGIRCITAPCFSMHEAKVNSTRARDIADLNLDAVGASQDDIAAAFDQLSNGRIIAAGVNKTVRVNRRNSVVLKASQVFLRLTNVVRNPLACTTTSECGTTMYPTKVTSAAECYCPSCPTPLANWASDDNAASWNQFCATSHDDSACPARPCAPPPPVACLAGGQCGFDF